MGKRQPLPPPLLLTSHCYQSELQSFYNLLDDRYHTTSIPILRNKSIPCSAYGWLLLIDCTDGQCCLWNPTSLRTIRLLLVLELPSLYFKCFLSKPPTEPDCFILFNMCHSIKQIVYRIQDDAVFNLDLYPQGNLRLLSMVSFQGTIYGIVQPRLTPKYEFVTIHMVGDKFETKPILLIDSNLPWEVPQPVRNWVLYNMDYLIESPCGNELLLVIKMVFSPGDNAVHFRVYRVDVSRMVCEELHNLDGRTVFIDCDGNGFCRSSEPFGAAIKPNSIYYTDRFGMVMYVYDMDDRSSITLLPCPGADIDPETAKSFWVDLPADIPMKNSLHYFHVS